MDPVISKYPFQPFGEDLNLCPEHGIAYQKSMEVSVEYGKDYFEKYIGYEGADIALRINEFRVSFTNPNCECLLDIGIGSGEFIKNSKVKTYGFDINPYAIQWLQERAIYCDPYEGIPEEIKGITMWDALEHFPEPSRFLNLLRSGMHIFLSIPIFEDLLTLKQSKHYKPNEHYYYFTENGMIKYFQDLGFSLVETSRGETTAGRESIGSFHFIKN